MSGKTSDQKKENEVVFTEAYEGLNTEQKKAVDTIEGPVMVIAGPGTGKTQILTLRIANILRQTDTKPENILALTFTESGVRAMRTRLAGFIGSDAYHVPIHTFHSFAGEMIRKYPDSYQNIVGGRPASDLEKIMLIEDLLENGEYKQLRPHGDHTYYVKPVLNAISTLKKEDISPDKFATHIEGQISRLNDIEQYHTKGAHKGKVRGEYLTAEKFLNRNQELLSLYRQYISGLKAARLYDFEDMILDTIVALENNQEMLFDVQEQYQYILADEHQDVNQSQNHLIELVASYHENPNVFVVGDEKQAIYRFQGASLDNFLYFENVYKGATTISLTNNYRSDQFILDLAHECIKSDDPLLKDLRVPLTAFNKYEADITSQSFSHRAVEDTWLVDELKKHHGAGVSWQEMAVIVRTNNEIEQLATLMRKAGVPVSPSSDNDILSHPIFVAIKKLLRAVLDIKSEAALAEVLQAPYWGISASDMVAIFQAQSYEKPLREIVGSEENLKEAGVQNTESVLRITRLFEEARGLGATKTPAQILEFLLQESGFFNWVLKSEVYDAVRVVRRVYDEVEAMFDKKEALDLASVLTRFEMGERHNISISAPFIEIHSDAVGLMTAHKAKGLEFEVVVIPHLNDNVWGATTRSSTFELPVVKHEVEDVKAQAEDDERRLFYVALTRAKRVLTMSYSETNGEGKDLVPSRFLVGIEGEVNHKDTKDYENKFDPLGGLRSVPKPTIDPEFLRIALTKRGWSATSFNNYHKSPWEYIYKNVLRVPTIKTPELQFGSAVHSVLEKIVIKMSRGEKVEVTEIKVLLDQVLGKSLLTVAEFTRNHERAFNSIMAYLPHLESSLGKTYKTEYSLKAPLKTGLADFPEVMLSGNFDRLDFAEDGRVVKVVDYKTGKPKTRGVIEGKTKTSDGNYKRQLVFYALLLSLHKDEEFHCRTGVLSFVEPDTKGVIHEESFTILDEEIEELKGEIIKATDEVVSGHCLQIECDESKCDYCHLIKTFSSAK
ncbi:MAG: ATP-dependent helicase [Candidatus Nomurabacteria bacterium]|nr:MAG: ATP-dependent helicase [Candidatus Nomurabacteria bacterium]